MTHDAISLVLTITRDDGTDTAPTFGVTSFTAQTFTAARRLT